MAKKTTPTGQPVISLSYQEAEDNRRDPQWGDPVQQLALHASHWLEVAVIRFPHLSAQIDALGERLDVAVGTLSTQDGHFFGTGTDGEIVVALEKIVGVMRDVAPLLVDRTRQT